MKSWTLKFSLHHTLITPPIVLQSVRIDNLTKWRYEYAIAEKSLAQPPTSKVRRGVKIGWIYLGPLEYKLYKGSDFSLLTNLFLVLNKLYIYMYKHTHTHTYIYIYVKCWIDGHPFLVLFPASRVSFLDSWYDYLRYCFCSVYCLGRKRDVLSSLWNKWWNDFQIDVKWTTFI